LRSFARAPYVFGSTSASGEFPTIERCIDVAWMV
jgi:hypothetical protein